jgi:hypothetical protein
MSRFHHSRLSRFATADFFSPSAKRSGGERYEKCCRPVLVDSKSAAKFYFPCSLGRTRAFPECVRTKNEIRSKLKPEWFVSSLKKGGGGGTERETEREEVTQSQRNVRVRLKRTHSSILPPPIFSKIALAKLSCKHSSPL